MDLQAIADSYDDPQTTPAEWERYWFNRPRVDPGEWLAQLDWDLCNAGVRSRTASQWSSAWTPHCRTTRRRWSRCRCPNRTMCIWWGCGNGRRTAQVDGGHRRGGERVRLAAMRWKVLEVACDPFVLNRTMEVLSADGLPVTEFRQSAQRMTPATQRVTALVRTHQLRPTGMPGWPGMCPTRCCVRIPAVCGWSRSSPFAAEDRCGGGDGHGCRSGPVAARTTSTMTWRTVSSDDFPSKQSDPHRRQPTGSANTLLRLGGQRV